MKKLIALIVAIVAPVSLVGMENSFSLEKRLEIEDRLTALQSDVLTVPGCEYLVHPIQKTICHVQHNRWANAGEQMHNIWTHMKDVVDLEYKHEVLALEESKALRREIASQIENPLPKKRKKKSAKGIMVRELYSMPKPLKERKNYHQLRMAYSANEDY